MAKRAKFLVNSGWWNLHEILVGEPQEFNANTATLRGRKGTPESYGRLPRSIWEHVSHADYVIYSYDTPIAWHAEGKWNTTPFRYSVTTSKHQGRVDTAISQIGSIEQHSAVSAHTGAKYRIA